MSRTFSITFDYLCPFARNGNEHVIAGLETGADWDVTFVPYSLSQGNRGADDLAVWDEDDPASKSGVLALQVGLAVRDEFPDHFLDAHRELFAARHDRGEDIKDRDVLVKALDAAGLEPDEVFAAVDTGAYLDVLRDEHTRAVEEHGIWGVPTFVAGSRAVFVRVLDRPEGRGETARDRIEQIVDLVADADMLHEFKQVDLPF